MIHAVPLPENPSDQALLDSIAAGRAEAEGGHLAQAERLFHEVLAHSRGSGGLPEIQACSSLVTLYSREQRDFETLPLARSLLEHGQRTDDPILSCRAAAALAGAYCDLLDRPRAEQALRDFELFVEALPEDSPRRRHFTRMVHGMGSDLALNHGDLPLAERELILFRKTFEPDRVAPGAQSEVTARERLWLLIHRAHFALHNSQFSQCDEFLAEARAISAPVSVGGLAMEYLTIWSALETAGPTAAVELAEDVLSQIYGLGLEKFANAQKVRFFPRIGDLIGQRCQQPDTSMKYYDHAASAAIGRIFELEQTLGKVPEFDELHRDDRTALIEYRQRFKKNHGQLLESVAALLRVSPRLPTPGHGKIVLCPCCEQIQTRAHHWLPAGHLIPTDLRPQISPHLQITQALCPACALAPKASPPRQSR